MLKRQLRYGILAIIGTIFFAIAMLFPIAIIHFLFIIVSGWTISPAICCASIVLVALAASFPLWCTKNQAWLAPLIVSLIIFVLDALVFFVIFFDTLRWSNLTLSSLLVIRDGNDVYFFIPIYALAISFSMLLAGSIVARKKK